MLVHFYRFLRIVLIYLTTQLWDMVLFMSPVLTLDSFVAWISCTMGAVPVPSRYPMAKMSCHQLRSQSVGFVVADSKPSSSEDVDLQGLEAYRLAVGS